MLVAVVAVAATLLTTGCSGDDPDVSGGEPTGPAAATGAPGAQEPAVDDDRLHFYPPVAGAQLTITNDVDGSESTVTVVSVQDGSAGQTIQIHQVFAGTDGLEVEAGYTAGTDGSLTLEIEMFLLAMTSVADAEGAVEASGDDMVIPSIEDLESGATSSGTAEIAMTTNGFEISNETSFTVSGAGYESVTTALGTFEAYVVDVDLSIVSSLGPTAEGTIRYWFVPGFGWVRQETTVNGMTIVNEVSSSTVVP